MHQDKGLEVTKQIVEMFNVILYCRTDGGYDAITPAFGPR